MFPRTIDVVIITIFMIYDFQKNQFYTRPKVANTQFGIHHYAGEVFYDTTGFLEKNRDSFPDDLLIVLQESRYGIYCITLRSINMYV